MKRLRWLLLAAAVVLETGCGLPDAFYLQPPSVSAQAAGLQNAPMAISGTTRGNDVNVLFQGYEIYYKCYASTDTTSVTADANFGSTSNTYTDLLTNGFHRVCRGPGSGGNLAVDTYPPPGTQNSPLIDVAQIDSGNAGNNYTVDIRFADSSVTTFPFNPGGAAAPPYFFLYTPPLPAPQTPTAGWEIRRFQQANASLGNLCSPFDSNIFYNTGFANWNQTDVDITAIYNTVVLSNTKQIYVSMYAVSYGSGLDNTPRFSSPVWLGYTLIDIFK